MASAIRRTIAKAREQRCQPYWETHAVAAGGAAALADQQFFAAVPTTFTGRPGAGIVSGNMQTAGQFPAPRQFLLTGVGYRVEATVAATMLTDLFICLNASLQFVISDKEYLRLMGWMAPAGGGGQAVGVGGAAAFAENGQALAYNYFRVKPAILIPMQQNFRWNLSGAAGLGNVTSPTYITVVMYGIEERAVQ